MVRTPPIFSRPRDWALSFLAATVGGLFFGVLGPFGNFLHGPTPVRIAYWIVTAWIGVAVYGGCILAACWLRDRTRLPLWLLFALAMVVGAAPLALITATIARWLWPDLSWLKPMAWYGQGLLISLPYMAASLLLIRLSGGRVEPDPRPAPPGPLTAALAGDVLCLQMEDHYVRVHTSTGSRLVLGALRDAIARLDGVDGLRVHRSWWVARRAVVNAVDGRQARLELTNGLSVPISRSAVATVRAAGWMPK